MLGPEHEFSIVDEQLKALPIADRILKAFHGKVVNSVEFSRFTLGKELQLHVMEVRPNAPFESPIEFEETMQEAVLTLYDFLKQKHQACLLGMGMHPLLKLDETGVWPHRHRQIYEAYRRVFNLKRHGWLNIQSFQLNLPYAHEKEGILLHNKLAEVCAYLPAIAASSPVYEDRIGENVDNRLRFYKENQFEVPSVTADIVPEYISSFSQYLEQIVGRYSTELAAAGADKILLNKEWVNSRGVIFRFDRRALEIRVMDEQECVKSDVALSCFIRALLRGLVKEENADLLAHDLLVNDFNKIVADGLKATVQHPQGRTAKQACQHYLRIASKNATGEEKRYLPIVEKRIERGNLSEIISKDVKRRSQKTELHEAIVDVYRRLTKSLISNQPYF